MKPFSKSLVVSVIILCVFGLRALIGLPAAFIAHDHGEFTQAVYISGIIGAFTGVAVCFGLAFAQWRTRGRWGLGIGIFAAVVFVMQSFLMYLAVSSGRVSLSAGSVANFVIFTVMSGLGLSIASFLSFAQRPRVSMSRESINEDSNH